MTHLVPADRIERTVGAPRHPTRHLGRAVSDEQAVYILHSAECLKGFPDLRACPYSLALDRGIHPSQWHEDRPVVLSIGGATGRLIGDLLWVKDGVFDGDQLQPGNPS